MKIVQCRNGHFYDQQRHWCCPVCQSRNIVKQKKAPPVELIQVQDSVIDDAKTLSMSGSLSLRNKNV